MSSNSRTLLSLPNETLSEILSYVLAQPNGPHRPAVLHTCSLLHAVGLPLLFQYVRVATFASYRSTFSKGGTLAPVAEGGKGMGRWVKELELDRLDKEVEEWSQTSRSLNLPSLKTLVVHHRLIESWVIDPSRPLSYDATARTLFHQNHKAIHSLQLQVLLRQLPSVTTLRYFASPTPTFPHPPSSGFWKDRPRPPVLSLLGIKNETLPPSYALPNLRTIHMIGDLILDDPRPVENNLVRTVSFSSLPLVETLIVEFRKDVSTQSRADSMYECLLRGSIESEWESRWKGLGRIELRRTEGGGAKLMEKRFRKSWENAGKAGGRGRSPSEERLGPLVVFVDKDGTERRLVE